MTQLFKIAARSALAAPIGAADTSLTVDITKADLFPAANTGTDPVPTIGKDWFKICLEDVNHNIEVIYVRTRTLGSATMGNLLRGQEGTTAISFSSGSTIVELRYTAEDLQDAIDLAAQATTPGTDLLWAASVDAQVKKLGQSLQKQLVTAFTTAGTSTAYTITPDPAIAAYAANLSFDVTFNQACGTDPTLAINGLASPPNLVKENADGSYANIKADEITANHRSQVKLLSPTQALVERLPVVQVATRLKTQATTGGTADAITLTLIPATTALDAGVITFRAASDSATATPTANVDGKGATVMVKANNQALDIGDIKAGMTHQIVYDTTYAKYILLNPYSGIAGKAGEIFDHAGTTAPANSLACPLVATNINRTTYARLFAAIGTTWGAGDGSTTFGMPYFPADYAAVQANANVGTSTTGDVKAHSHVYNLAAGETADSNNINGTNQGNVYTNSTNSTGGAANLAAGVRMLKCVRI